MGNRVEKHVVLSISAQQERRQFAKGIMGIMDLKLLAEKAQAQPVL